MLLKHKRWGKGRGGVWREGQRGQQGSNQGSLGHGKDIGFYSSGSISTLSYHPRTRPLRPQDLDFLQSCSVSGFGAHLLGAVWSESENNKAHLPACQEGPGKQSTFGLPGTHTLVELLQLLTMVHLQQRWGGGSGPLLSTDLLTPPWNVTFWGHDLIYLLLGPELRILRDSQHSKAKRSTESTPGANLPILSPSFIEVK